MRGRFISFEGVDGCGKSTQTALLARHLAGQQISVVQTREPGGTSVGEGIRNTLLASERMTPIAEAHLFAAARAELVATVIEPALTAGQWVICDRFIDSSLTYQGVARGLGIDTVWEINSQAVGATLPDQTILLTLSTVEAASRRDTNPDRIEREGVEFQRRVAEGYQQLAERFPERIAIVDGDGDIETVHRRVVAAVAG